MGNFAHAEAGHVLAVLGTLVFAGYWLEARGDSTEMQVPAGLGLESSDVP